MATRTAVPNASASGPVGPHVGRIAITWPSATNSWDLRRQRPTLINAETGEPIPNIVRFTVHVEAHGFMDLIADVEVYADADGRMLPSGELPLFTDAYQAWIGRGMPDGEEPTPQVRTATLHYIVVSMDAPARQASPKRVRVAVGERCAWVDEDRADLVRDMWLAGLKTLDEPWGRLAAGEAAISTRGGVEGSGANRAREILGNHGIEIVREGAKVDLGIRTYFWTKMVKEA